MSQIATTRHGTLTADTVATVSITGVTSLEGITVYNVDGTDEIYLTLAHSGATAATPTVRGNGTIPLLAQLGFGFTQDYGIDPHSGAIQVKLISNGTPEYSIVIDGA